MKKKGKIFAVILIIIIIVLIAIYNFGTSQYCIKKYILPIVSERTNSEIQVSGIELSLISSTLKITNLDYSSAELSMHSENFIIKTSIYDLLFKNKIYVKKVLLKNTNISLDISSKNDANITEEYHQELKKNLDIEKKSKKKSKLFKISLNDINVKNLNILVKNKKTVTQINNLNLRIPKIESEKECSINLDGKISLTNDKKQAEGFIKSKSIVTVNNNFMPSKINSTSLIQLDNYKIPLTISLITNNNGSFDFNLEITDILIKPFASAFVTGLYRNTEGKINSIKMKASGKDINNLLSDESPIKSTASISGVDISSQNNFYIKNRSTNASFDLASINKGNFLPDIINVNNLNAEYMDSDQLVKIDDLNIKLTKQSNNKIKTIINSGFIYNKGSKHLKGSIKGNFQLSGKNIFKPADVNSNIDLQMNGHSMPIIVKYENNTETEKAYVNIKNFEIAPLKDFLDTDTSQLSGRVSDISITLSGKGIDALKKGLNSKSNIISEILVKGLNLKDNGKYSAVIPYININLDLNKILNKKYYLNTFIVDNADLIIYKNTKTEKSTCKKFADKTKTNATLPAQSEKLPVQKRYGFNIKNLNIKNLKATIISDKKLTCSNVNIRSEQIQSNTLSKADVSLNYAIDSTLKGTINTQNNFLITSELVPEIFKSKMELINDNNKGYSNLDLKCKKISPEKVPFTLNVDIDKLLLDPFLMALAPVPYNKAKMNVDALTLNMKGESLYDFKTMDGEVTSNLNNITVPINVKGENIVEAIFFPIKVIAGLASNTALKFVSGNVSKSMIKIDDMFNRKKRVDFKHGNLNISLNSGLININEFAFYGVTNSPVSEMKASGSINLNNRNLNLTTNTILTGLIIPLNVKGTIDKPITNTAKLTAQILQMNRETIINTGIDTTNTVIDTINKIRDNNFVELLQTPSAKDSQQNPNAPANNTEPSSQQGSIGKAVINVLNILGSSSDQNKHPLESDKNNKKPNKVDEAIKNFLNF